MNNPDIEFKKKQLSNRHFQIASNNFAGEWFEKMNSLPIRQLLYRKWFAIADVHRKSDFNPFLLLQFNLVICFEEMDNHGSAFIFICLK